MYAVASDPANPSSNPAWPPGGNNDWGWMYRRHALAVGDRIHLSVSGPLWRVTGIAALPSDCKPFLTQSGPGGLLGGKLILQPVR
jgi:hypothetical protein